jgi:WD repeat-containing protein 44
MFSQPIGYIPRFAEPPKYIKVKAQGKKEKDFDRVFLAQELRGLSGVEIAQAGGRRINPAEKTKRGEAIWALEFSKDGRYLAAAGEDHIVRVWAVIASDEDRREEEREEESAKTFNERRLSAPVFKRKPIREYEGHTGTILDLSWSKNNFLLSSSMDKTVRLWHTSRSECLCAFKHSDYITSIQFHPRDDRFFLAGSLDSKLRLWSIPDKSVAYWAKTNDLITAVAFTPDGKIAIAGCLTGLCVFFELDGQLRYLTQMHVRSSHGKNAKGSKITGIQAINWPPHEPNGDIKLLITSNDSRARIYNYRDKSVQSKFKGLENTSSQIRASFSDDARYVISGSEDKKAYIWPSGSSEKDKDKHPMEVFEAHTCAVTAAIMAPTRTRQLLQASGDPLFELCNPPPVQLVSRSESQSSELQSELGEDPDSIPPTPSRPKPEESPAYLARSCHRNGNIIVTADFQGKIKVFRQDCAYKQRLKSNENWDTGSTFSKKMMKRTSSIATRASRHSLQDSLPYPSMDRIHSWRQSIDRSSLPANSPRASNDTFSRPSPHRATFPRSHSPRKAVSNSKLNPNRMASTASTPTISTPSFSAPQQKIISRSDSSQNTPQIGNARSDSGSERSEPAENILPDGTTASAMLSKVEYAAQFANRLERERTKSISEGSTQASRNRSMDTRAKVDERGHLFPKKGLGIDHVSSRASSIGNVSMLTDELSGQDEEDEEVNCKRCGNGEFKARKKARGNVLVCVRCGLELL